MLKKFVSNALLSVVMDKKARDKLQAVKDSKKRGAEPAPTDPTVEKPSAASSKEKSELEARADRYGAMLAGAAPPSGDAVEESPDELIRQALESAEAELLNKKRGKKPMTPERQALINQAMAIHQSKTHLLDDLDDESREKLYVMAMEALKDHRGE